MWKAALQLLATIADWWSWRAKRKAAIDDDPVEQDKKRRSEIARELATNDQEAINRRLADDLARLRVNKSLHGDSSGQGSAKD